LSPRSCSNNATTPYKCEDAGVVEYVHFIWNKAKLSVKRQFFSKTEEKLKWLHEWIPNKSQVPERMVILKYKAFTLISFPSHKQKVLFNDFLAEMATLNKERWSGITLLFNGKEILWHQLYISHCPVIAMDCKFSKDDYDII
jgi:hypothetical protein